MQCLARGPPHAPTGMTVVGLDHVQVAAPPGCEAAARRFYGDLLGLREIGKPPALRARGGCWFTLGGHELHVGVSDDFTPATKAHPGIRVASIADVQALAERLGASGHAVVWGEEAEIDGRVRFYVHDPWGNRLEFLCDRG